MWTLDDTQFLIHNYYTLGANKCAEILGRTKGSIRNKASRLGLKSSITKANNSSGQYSEFIKTTEFELIGTYSLSNIKTLHRHKTCGYEWEVTPNNIKGGQGCPGCGKVAKLSDEQYTDRLLKTNFRHLATYNGSDIKILHKHISCGHEWNVRPHDILRGQNCPKCSKKNYSTVAIDWLNSFNNPNILHAENGGEQTILGFKVDGYDIYTNTVYEFHGDVFHGNLDIFHEDDRCHPFDMSITAGELWSATFNKMQTLSSMCTVLYIWERDYRNGKTFSRF